MEGPAPEIWLMPSLVINPGETLVITTHRDTTPEMLSEFKERIEEHLERFVPGVNVVVISGANVSKLTN